MRGPEPRGKNHSTVRACPKVENAPGVPSGATGSANGDGCLGAVKDPPADCERCAGLTYVIREFGEIACPECQPDAYADQIRDIGFGY